MHTGDKPFSCSSCDKNFEHFSLNELVRTHSDENPFSCSSFGKKISELSCLHAHFRTHSDENSFSCSSCDQQFSSNYVSMYEHIRIHSDEKPFRCSSCDTESSKFVIVIGLVKNINASVACQEQYVANFQPKNDILG